MGIGAYIPFWNQLTENQKDRMEAGAVQRKAAAGTLLQGSGSQCLGFVILRSGRLRVYILSDEGREITLYRLFERDMCLFTASCVMKNIQFDVLVEAEMDTQMWVVPPELYKSLMEESAAAANYTNQLIGSRFSEVMWLLEQVMWKSFDRRLAAFLLEESRLEGTPVLKITHERIAAHMGTAREVVTRMLRYFQNEGLVRLSRGTVELADEKRLAQLEADS